MLENYNLSKLNIIAIADKKFEQKSCENFYNLKCIAPFELANINCDVIFPFPNNPDLNKILIHDTMVSISFPSAKVITQEPDILYDFTTYGKEEFLRHNMPMEYFI